MDGQIRIRQLQDMRALPPRPAHTTLNLPQQPNKPGLDSLRKAILDCALQATRAEPHDSDRRLHSFIAKLSGTMEGLGERDLDAVLWNLMATNPVPLPVSDAQLCMEWWSALSDQRRAYWLAQACTQVPYAAWLAFLLAEDDLATDG